MMRRRVTIEDVARAAGVSRQTVSRAINNKGEISPLTLERVMNAIHQLGYRPSWVARGLATHRTCTLGLVVPDITNPFFPEVARGVQDAARTRDYHVFLYNTDESAEREHQILYSLASQPVDGILLLGSRIADVDLLAFVEHYRPLVVLNRHVTHPGVGMVLVDNLTGARLAVERYISWAIVLAGWRVAWPPTAPARLVWSCLTSLILSFPKWHVVCRMQHAPETTTCSCTTRMRAPSANTRSSTRWRLSR
ncbi:MAG: LacI family DNA-binding transcriptional regulator [Anaerolineae bacterium]